MSTSAPVIFEPRERTDPTPGRNGERAFHFLDRVDDSCFARVRGLIDGWFVSYAIGDEVARRDLRRRIQSGDDTNFYGAAWELYVHETFRRLGFSLTIHPPTPTGKEIDFLAQRGDLAVYIEATTFPRDGLRGGGLPKGTSVVLSKIDQGYSPDFTIGVQIGAGGSAVPATAAVTEPIETWLGSLDWASERAAMEAGDSSQPSLALHVDGWEIGCSAYPRMAADSGDRSMRLISVYPSIGGFSSGREDLRRKLKHKAYRYGDLDAPYLIAVETPGAFTDEEDVMQALYGPEVVEIDADALVAVETTRMPDGLWRQGSTTRAGRVSGVLVDLGAGPYSTAKRWPTLWANPWADHSVADLDWPWPQRVADLASDRVELREASSEPAEFFDLPADWPGEPFAEIKRLRRERRAAA